MPLFSWHKQDNMLASACVKMELLGWIFLSKWFTVPWAFNQCYFSSEICNDTFCLLALMMQVKQPKENESGNQTIIRKWHGESEGQRKLVHSQQVAQVHKSFWNAALSLSILSTLQCSIDKVEIAVEFRQMSLSNFKANQHTVEPSSNPISAHSPAVAHLLGLSPPASISLWNKSTIWRQQSNQNTDLAVYIWLRTEGRWRDGRLRKL